MTPDKLVQQFESLGDNCEFGLVQRQAGAEPLGLFRFAGFTGALDQRLEELVAALDRGFEGLGSPETIHVTVEGPPTHSEFIVHEGAYGLHYHTFLSPTDTDAAKLRRDESVRLRFLCRKLLTDLGQAAKTFVWKSNLPVDIARIRRLLAALRRHGPVTLLWVCADPAAGRVGTVERLEDGLLRGVVDRFAPYDAVADISHGAWMAVCEAAARIVHRPDVQAHGDRPVHVATLRSLIERAGQDPSVGGIRGSTVLAPAGSYAWSRPLSGDVTDLDERLRGELDGYYGTNPVRHEAVLKVVLEDALVATHGAVITRDGYLLRESCWEFIQDRAVPNGMARVHDGAYRFTADPKRHVRDPALLLKRPWWRSYRHFLIDAASLLAFAAQHLDVTKLQLVIGKEDDPTLRRTMHDLIDMLAPGTNVLEQSDEEIWRFSDLHYVTPVHIPPMFKLPQAMSALRSRALAAVGAHRVDPPAPRLLLLPDPAERPRLINVADLVNICAEFNFTPVHPEQLSMADRIALFRDADICIGIKTTQLANIVFCKPDALVIVLSPGDWPDPFYAELAGQMGLRYRDIFGLPVDRAAGPSQNPFRIDPDHVRRVLMSLLMVAPVAASPPLPAVDPEAPPAFERFLQTVVYPEHRGASYLSVLDELHQALRPRSYLEIGTQFGEAFSLARCPSLAIDPDLLLPGTAIHGKPAQFLFRMTSDAFFDRYDPMRFLGGAVTLAFLDGPQLHFEHILRDFMHLERFCSPYSIVAIHDVAPLDIYMACRDQLDDFRRSRSVQPTWWTGDVWKLMGVLQKYRPDLVIGVLDAQPSGLLLVQGLEPTSTTLQEHYDQIVQDVMSMPDEAADFARFRAGLRLRGTAELPDILKEREMRARRAP